MKDDLAGEKGLGSPVYGLPGSVNPKYGDGEIVKPCLTPRQPHKKPPGFEPGRLKHSIIHLASRASDDATLVLTDNHA